MDVLTRRALPALSALLALLSGCASSTPHRYSDPFDARVIWAQGDRVYLAARDSIRIEAGVILRFHDRNKEVAVGEITGVHEAQLIAARLTSGSLAKIKKLERVQVTSEPPPIQRIPLLRVGYPSKARVHPFFRCTELTLQARGYRADTLGERSFRLVRDSTWVPHSQAPDTLLARLFDDVADEEIALERGELDVAIFWPGEASAHIREAMEYDGRTKAHRERGYIMVENGGERWTEASQRLHAMNSELFRGDLSMNLPILEVGIPSKPAPCFEVEASLPGRDRIERFLNKDCPTGSRAEGRVLVRYHNGHFIWDNAGACAIDCPVLCQPEIRRYVASMGLVTLVNLFDCKTPDRKP